MENGVFSCRNSAFQNMLRTAEQPMKDKNISILCSTGFGNFKLENKPLWGRTTQLFFKVSGM